MTARIVRRLIRSPDVPSLLGTGHVMALLIAHSGRRVPCSSL